MDGRVDLSEHTVGYIASNLLKVALFANDLRWDEQSRHVRASKNNLKVTSRHELLDDVLPDTPTRQPALASGISGLVTPRVHSNVNKPGLKMGSKKI